MKYITKILKVEAQQYILGQDLPPGVKLGNFGVGKSEAYCLSNKGGMLLVEAGDYVVEELDGTYYPVPEDIFLRKYHPCISEVPHLTEPGT